MAPRVIRGSSATVPSTSSPTRAINVESDDDNDEDAFMRNKSAKTWQTLNKFNKREAKTKVVEISSDSDVSGDGASDGTPKAKGRKPKAKSKAKPKPPVAPTWTKRAATTRLATTSDEDEDSDVIILKDSNGPREGRSLQKGSKKRQRSRSRSSGSLTPPPELTKEEKARAKAVVENALQLPPPAKKQRTPPVEEDLDLDFSGSLNPELAKIAKRVLAAPAKKPAAKSLSSKESVLANVQWLSHPINEAGAPLRTWKFVINRGETFASTLLPNLQEQVGADADIVLRHEGKRVFRTSTPDSLHIWGEADFQACTPATWEYLQSHPEEAAVEAPPVTPVDRGVSEAPTEPSADESEDTFTLILRAKDRKDISLKVKPTATAAKVVAAYLKKLGGAPLSAAKKKAVHLICDGESVPPTKTLADLELEDEDVLDVRGL
ncbi:hypothetical protein EXIGLDRAFT_724202 [Exidia glandulosa HHB12029]|uniref:Rad60/SUMO-like domain-containing protein n=1 Tax=Exidia glandulosa HHB12029 TaxID=1314781 RepID=A0A165EI70_EXIGL|nr:hypothetical protein EXIGLDRAFT_724202 [Exidia glandulosa HHB12029]